VLHIKLFKTLLIVIPCLIVAVLCLLAIPKEDNYILDEVGDLEAFDEPEYVTNSEMGFFYKRDQLSTYRKQKKPDKVKNIKIAENIVTTDFTKKELTVLPDISTCYTCTRNVVMYGGEGTEFLSLTDNVYTLKGGAQVPKEDTFDIILNTGVLGHSDLTPHRIVKGNTYYAAFTDKLDSVYFEFSTSNEFLSVLLGGITGRVEYELYDSSMNTITTAFNASESVEIKYKGRGPAKYYLRVTGSYQDALKPFSVKLSSDENEWMWQMPYPAINQQVAGRFDYYGDDDYFVLPADITNEINKSVVRFITASHDINVVIYNKEHEILGQYVYSAQKPEAISMYGLEGAYAMSLYSYSGENSGAEYSFIFEHTNITVLDIETFGFELKPGFTEDNEFYTATVKSLDEKKISDVMYSPKEAEVEIKVTHQNGNAVTVKLGDTLPLMPGRNTVDLTVNIGGVKRTVTIVITDPTRHVYYGKMLEKADVLKKGQKVLVIGEEDSKYRVQTIDDENVAKTFLVEKDKVNTGYVETQIPDNYREKIDILREKYPNWKFKFVKAGTAFDKYVDSQVGGKTSVLDNTGVAASREQIAYAVNPENFLDEKNIFMFEDATYNPNIEYRAEGIQAIWNDRYIAHDVFSYYALNAGETSHLSPYFVTARASIESGNGGSKLAQGMVSGYEGYYNFFGIGAYDYDPNNAGAARAKLHSWTTKQKAIIGGAIWIDTNYISAMQPNIYFMKFNPSTSSHQYMTDINAPKKDAVHLYNANAAAGTLDSEHIFIIPVYE